MPGNPTADLLGAIVNAGKTAWDIVKDGKATSSAASSYCSAVPEKVKFTDLSGWKTKTGTWKWQAENVYGFNVIDCELKYSFMHSGQTSAYKDALFVTNFSVWCTRCEVAFMMGFDCNATVKGEAYNAGSKTKVIGAIPILVRVSGSGLNNISSTWELTAKGDGTLGVS